MILSKENIESIDLDLEINRRIKNGLLDTFLIIVPTNRKLRSLKKEIISLSPNKVTTSINIETLTTLSNELLEQTESYHLLSEEASAVFIEQSAQIIEKKYFTNYKEAVPSGTLDRIRNVISKYKEEGISPELLRNEAEKLSKLERLKALDIANIFKEYNQKCQLLKAYELGDIYQQLANLKQVAFQNSFTQLFNNVELILIDGFNEFTNLELTILSKLTEHNNIKVFLNFDYSSFNPILFSHLAETNNKLAAAGFRKIGEKSSVSEDVFLDRVKERLFLETPKEIENRFQDRITCITAASREKEVELIAKEIKSLLLSNSAKPHEICVTFNLIKNYSQTVRDVFTLYGLPFNLTDRFSLDRTLSVTAIINFLEIAESDYYYKSILRALSNSFIEIEGFDVNALLYSAKMLKIIIGRENWNFNLNNAIKALELDHENFDRNAKLEKYKSTQNGLKKLDNLLSPFNNKMKPSKFVKELLKLVEELKLSSKLLLVNNVNKDNDVKALTTFLNSTEEVFHLLSPEEKTRKHELSFYLNKIRVLSQTARFNIKERPDYGVLVTNIDEIRDLKFKHTFLGGMIDGDFPTKYQPEIFFSGKFSRKEKQHVNEERYRFYQGLKSWSKSFYLTYPSSDGDKETVKSNFLDEFEKKFRIKYKAEEDFINLIYSKEEVQKNIISTGFPKDQLNDSELLCEISNWEKAIAVEKLREDNPYQKSPYNGFLFETGGIDQIDTNDELSNFRDRAYSISQLETYTACPFRYFLERVLNIEIAEEPDEQMEAIELGSLLHAILFEFYVRIREENIVIRNCSDAVFEKVKKMIFKIAEKHVSNIIQDSPFAFYEEEKIFGINSNKEDSLLFRFLLNERNDKTGRDPAFFEVSFGVRNDEYDPMLYSAKPLQYENVKIRGLVDRVDIDKNKKTFEVVDYKSGGKKVSKTEIEKGTSLQLPVYIWAVKTLLQEQLGEVYSPKAMSIYNLKYQETIFGKNAVSVSRSRTADFDPTPDLNQLVDKALHHVKKSVDNIINGNFPITPFSDEKDKICRFCNFNTICRVDELLK